MRRKTEGCYGAAGQAGRYDAKFDRVHKGLLGGTVVSENMDAAIGLARKTHYAFRIVTLDGDVINPQGSITGGSRKNDIANIFSHERELKELNAALSKIQQELKYQVTAADGTKREWTIKITDFVK